MWGGGIRPAPGPARPGPVPPLQSEPPGGVQVAWCGRVRVNGLARARARLCVRAQALAEGVVINSSFKSDVELDSFGKVRSHPHL